MRFLEKTELKLFFTVWLVYLFFISGFGGNWMANSMLGLTVAIVDDHAFSIDKYVKGAEDNVFFNGHYYSGFAPGASFLAVPPYFIFKPIFYLVPHNFLGYSDAQLKLIMLNFLATVFISSLFAAMASVLVFKFCSNFTKNECVKLLTAFVFSFGTLFFLYSTTFDAKVVSTFFSFLAFYILFVIKRDKNYKSINLFYAGLLLGFAVSIEYSQVIALAILSLYLLTFLRNRKLLFFVAGVFIPVLLLLAYNQAVFSNPIANPYTHRASDYIILEYNKGFGLSQSSLYGLSFSPFRGIFFYMPIMLASLIGVYYWFKSKKYCIELFLILFLFIAFFFYNAIFRSELFWSAGCSFGPRHLLPVIPFMILPLAFMVDKLGKFFVLLLGFLSFMINLLPNLYGVTHLWTYKCMEANPLKYYLPFIFEKGLTNYTFSLITQIGYTIPVYFVNLIMIMSILCLIFVIWKIWKA